MKRECWFLFLFFLLGCSSNPQKESDPLRNSRELIKEGHVSLYQNGAFQVPMTHVFLVPPAPQPLEVVSDLIGVNAKASLQTVLSSAKDSVSVVSDGMRVTYKVSGVLSESGAQARNYIQSAMRPGAKLIIEKSSKAGNELIGESWDYGKKYGDKLENTARNLRLARESGEQKRIKRKNKVSNLADKLDGDSSQTYKNTKKDFVDNMNQTSQNWILGYARLDGEIAKNESEYESKKSLERFAESAYKNQTERRETSDKLVYLMSGVWSESKIDASKSFANAKNEISSGVSENGYTLAAVKSIGWYLKGVFWDYGLVPLSKSAVGGIGYVLYNGIAYPAIVVTTQASNATMLAVEYSKLKLSNTYEYVAPSVGAAFAGVMTTAQATGGFAKASFLKAEAVTVAICGQAAVEAGCAVEKAGLYTGEKTIHYVGVPLATVGVATGAATTGAAIMGAGYAGGGIAYGTGEVAAYATDLTLKTGAGVVAIGGGTASVVAGAGVGVFEVAQSAVVVPATVLGAGITLGYGAASQIAAHSILAAADASYLVLSMEGPKFVVYSVKEVVSRPDKDIPAGTVIDLNELQRRDYEIKKLPLSDEEIDSVVDGMKKDLKTKDESAQ